MTPDGTSLLWLVLVIAMIPAALWFLKRTPLGQAALPGSARLVATLPLSASQRVVTVEVGRGEQRTWLVLGVTPHGINNLYTMAPPDDAGSSPAAAPSATLEPLLQRLRGHRPDDPV